MHQHTQPDLFHHRRRRLAASGALLIALATGTAQATTPADLLAGYTAQAGAPAQAARGSPRIRRGHSSAKLARIARTPRARQARRHRRRSLAKQDRPRPAPRGAPLCPRRALGRATDAPRTPQVRSAMRTQPCALGRPQHVEACTRRSTLERASLVPTEAGRFRRASPHPPPEAVAGTPAVHLDPACASSCAPTHIVCRAP